MEKEITKDPKIVSHRPSQSEPKGAAADINEKPSGAHYASEEQFANAHRKTTTRHAGLFQRLAK
jgi:hypothetical protein